MAATPLASLRDVATQLVTNEFSGMPVAASDGRVVGVITESDIVRTLIDEEPRGRPSGVDRRRRQCFRQRDSANRSKNPNAMAYDRGSRRDSAKIDHLGGIVLRLHSHGVACVARPGLILDGRAGGGKYE